MAVSSSPRRKTCVLYVRLSVSDDASTSVARQRADLEAWADREGFRVVAVLEDDGISGRKQRANADEALRMLRSGEADALAVWKLDRWSRMGLAAIADLIESLDTRHGAALFVALNDGLNSDQPAWRLIAAVLSEVARMEAENTSLRVRSSRAKAVRDGYFHGGTVPFGYRVTEHPMNPAHKALVPDPDELGALTTVINGVLDGGWSLTDAMRYLNDSPVKPRRAARWTPTSLQMILTGHALLGRVTRDGAPILDETGEALAPWEPLVTVETWHRLRQRFSDPRTRSRATAAGTPPKRKPKAERLLSGKLFCGSCGSVMYANHRTVKGQPQHVYSCSAAGQGKTCPRGVKVTAEQTEDFLASEFLSFYGHLPAVEVTEVYEGTSPAALAEIESAITTTLAELRRPGADRAAVHARLDALVDRESELKAAPASVSLVRTPLGVTVRELWETSPERRYWLLSGALQSATVAPGKPGRGFDTSRIEPVWTGDLGDPYVPDYDDPAEYSSGPIAV